MADVSAAAVFARVRLEILAGAALIDTPSDDEDAMSISRPPGRKAVLSGRLAYFDLYDDHVLNVRAVFGPHAILRHPCALTTPHWRSRAM
jgi:hypothetical protein